MSTFEAGISVEGIPVRHLPGLPIDEAVAIYFLEGGNLYVKIRLSSTGKEYLLEAPSIVPTSKTVAERIKTWDDDWSEYVKQRSPDNN